MFFLYQEEEQLLTGRVESGVINVNDEEVEIIGIKETKKICLYWSRDV
jgi:translation elongation factor EF-Tu-like GTPase